MTGEFHFGPIVKCKRISIKVTEVENVCEKGHKLGNQASFCSTCGLPNLAKASEAERTIRREDFEQKIPWSRLDLLRTYITFGIELDFVFAPKTRRPFNRPRGFYVRYEEIDFAKDLDKFRVDFREEIATLESIFGMDNMVIEWAIVAKEDH